MIKVNNWLKKGMFFSIVLLFSILSYFKFYTIKVSFSNDPTVAIVKTKNVQLISNSYRIDRDMLPYNWYDDYGFKLLHADEMGHMWERVHSFIIILWWVILVYLSFNLIKLIIRKYKIIS